MFLPHVLSFWFINTGGLAMIFYSIWDANNMPMAIYSRLVRGIGVYVLPFMIITNFGPLWVMNKLSVYQLVWGLSSPIVALICFRLLWKQGIKKYNSASS
ncbi:hypothetical protein D3C86_1911700 [compost metagenome]